MNRRTFLSGLAAALVAANTVLGFGDVPETEINCPTFHPTAWRLSAAWDYVLTDDEVRLYHEGLEFPPLKNLTYWKTPGIPGYWSNDG